MKRKTNLFYLEGLDSNFITFSNYTENLTGNNLTTNTKLFPSKFLCLYLPWLDNLGEDGYLASKKDFIKFLFKYYENKLAFTRDYCTENDLQVENIVSPLSYLIDAIEMYNNLLDPDLVADMNKMIVHIGDVIENNYNGIYQDQIFTISGYLNDIENIVLNRNDELNLISCEDEYLHGWHKEELENVLEDPDILPVFDDEDRKEYNILSSYSSISLTNKSMNSDLKFNILIPIYNTINIDSDNFDLRSKIYPDSSTINLLFSNETTQYTLYNMLVPFGIWFSGVNAIELKYDNTSKVRTSWSLTLSSLFKPFPYSNAPVQDLNEISNNATLYTFAEILKNYSLLAKSINDMNVSISNILNQIKDIKNKLDNSGSCGCDTEFINELDNRVVKLEEKLLQYDIMQADSASWTYLDKN